MKTDIKKDDVVDLLAVIKENIKNNNKKVNDKFQKMRVKIKTDLKKAKTINEEINMTITRYEYAFDKISKFKDRLAENITGNTNTKSNENLPKFVDTFNYNTNSAYSTAYNSNKKEVVENLYYSEKSNTDKKVSDFNLFEFKSPTEKVQTLETLCRNVCKREKNIYDINEKLLENYNSTMRDKKNFKKIKNETKLRSVNTIQSEEKNNCNNGLFNFSCTTPRTKQINNNLAAKTENGGCKIY